MTIFQTEDRVTVCEGPRETKCQVILASPNGKSLALEALEEASLRSGFCIDIRSGKQVICLLHLEEDLFSCLHNNWTFRLKRTV